MIANAHRDPRRQRRAFTVADFMPRTGEAVQSPEQQAAILLFASRASRKR